MSPVEVQVQSVGSLIFQTQVNSEKNFGTQQVSNEMPPAWIKINFLR